MPVFSRLGPYDRALLDRLAGHDRRPADRRLVEYWAHEASLIPVESHPLFRWRMAGVDADAWGSIRRVVRERPELVADTLRARRRAGSRSGRARPGSPRPDRQPGDMWNWHDGKVALEYLFFTGQVMAAGRVNFERLYDLPERVLPAEVARRLRRRIRPSAQRQLVADRRRGARASPPSPTWATTSACPAPTPRLASPSSPPRASSSRCEVAGWGAPAYLWPDGRRPRRVEARALLSPFDSLVLVSPARRAALRLSLPHRDLRARRPSGSHGYYVLPFLLGDALVGRVDLKSDRQNGSLLVQARVRRGGRRHRPRRRRAGGRAAPHRGVARPQRRGGAPARGPGARAAAGDRVLLGAPRCAARPAPGEGSTPSRRPWSSPWPWWPRRAACASTWR